MKKSRTKGGLPDHFVLRRRNHEEQAAVIRGRVVVLRPGFGPMIVTDLELASCTETAPLKNKEFFRRSMAMRGITGTGSKTDE